MEQFEQEWTRPLRKGIGKAYAEVAATLLTGRPMPREGFVREQPERFSYAHLLVFYGHLESIDEYSAW